MTRKRTCAYQGVRNVSFSENFAYALNGWPIRFSSKWKIIQGTLEITSSRFILNSTLKIVLWSYICMIMWRLLCNNSLAYYNGCNAWLVDLKCYQVFWIMFCINSLVLLLPWMNLRVNEFKFSSCFNFKVERHRVFVILPGWFIRF